MRDLFENLPARDLYEPRDLFAFTEEEPVISKPTIPESVISELTIPEPPDTPKPVEQEGHWEGWIKPTLKEVGEAATIGTAETALSTLTSMALWPVSELRGLGELLRGKTAEEAKQTRAEIAGKAYQPRTESAKGATGMIGAGFELGLTPARMAGEEVERMGYPKGGYLTELAGTLFAFKFGGKAAGMGKQALKQRAAARGMFNKKMAALTKEQREMVNTIAERNAKPRDLVQEEVETKKHPAESAFEQQKDIWIGEKDARIAEAKIEERLLRKELKETTGKTKDAAKYDEAVQLYIDTKRDPSHIEKFYDNLTPKQKKVVELSQNLPENIRVIADKIEQSYKNIGIESLDAGVVKNLLDDYASRTWVREGKRETQAHRKFGTTTRHAKPRRFKTILEGWSEGYELRQRGATTNLRTYKEELIKTIEDKRFVNELKKLKTEEGDPLLSTSELKDYKGENYIKVEHPNFVTWEPAGKVEPGKVHGKNFFMTDEGVLLERRTLYAPKKEAKNLNRILGISSLYKIPGVRGLTKFNEVTKAWILQTSLFHYVAFAGSYYLGTNHKGWKDMSYRQAYKEGIKLIETSDPILMHGTRNGLTWGLKQDWIEPMLKEGTWIGRWLDKTKATKAVKDSITNLRERQADFLFGEVGAGLKAKSYMLEFKNQVKKYPHENKDVIAKRVARLINDDFGGLHLERLGRDPTLQHIFRLVALAPDWTESNVRTMVKTVKNMTKDQRELYLYQKFWGGIVVKSLGIIALLNYASAGGDVDVMVDNYKRAWESGNFNWAKWDITPIYKFLGGKSKDPRYYNVMGHFQDPAKFIVHPIKSMHHKSSVVAGMAHEALAGVDWKGQRFSTFEELYKTGKTVQWGPGHPISYEQFPAYTISQLIGTQPIQLQNLIGWMTGEIDAFDAMARSLGLRTSRGYSRPEGKGLKTLKGL